MRRGHTAADYRRRVDAIRQSRRRLALTSDVIVGFPGESEEDFADTMRLVRDCEYDGLFIFKYSKRAGTPAALLENSVPETEKKSRFLALEELQESLQHKIYGDYVGREVSVLVERESTRSSDDMTGHSTCNKVVNFKAANTRPGDVVDILISQAKPYSLYGELVSRATN
ncbi:MAG TPA: TRAM domain-containing protein, partial [Pyrinomonadaceae bacterium]|nr:TRAM domain-containing protein [Pyrinomonadaceae bacterium]